VKRKSRKGSEMRRDRGRSTEEGSWWVQRKGCRGREKGSLKREGRKEGEKRKSVGREKRKGEADSDEK
jgi:hypothetical protein